MQASVMTPQQSVYSGEAKDIRLTADRGQINILEGHANIITTIQAGALKIIGPSGQANFEISEGVLRIENNQCSILCMNAKAV